MEHASRSAATTASCRARTAATTAWSPTSATVSRTTPWSSTWPRCGRCACSPGRARAGAPPCPARLSGPAGEAPASSRAGPGLRCRRARAGRRRRAAGARPLGRVVSGRHRARPAPFEPGPARCSRSARRPACTPAWPSPTATRRGPRHRPASSPGPRPSWSGPAATRRARVEPASVAPTPGHWAGSPATPGTTTTPRCAPRWGGGAVTCAGTGWRAVVFADDNAPGRPRGGLPGRPGLVRQERQPAAARGRAPGSCSARSSPTRRCRPARARLPTAAVPAAAASTAVPTGAIVAAGRGRRRRAASRGWCSGPASFPRQFRVALGDRIYGCDDCQEVCPPEPSPSAGAERVRARPPTAADGGRRPMGRSARRARCEADDATLLARHGRWYLADRDPRWLRRNALVALATSARGDDPEVVEATLARYLARRRPDAAGPRGVGGDAARAPRPARAWSQTTPTSRGPRPS